MAVAASSQSFFSVLLQALQHSGLGLGMVDVGNGCFLGAALLLHSYRKIHTANIFNIKRLIVKYERKQIRALTAR